MPKVLTDRQVIGTYRKNVGGMRVATVHDGMLSTSFEDIVGYDRAACEAAHRAAFRPLPPRLSCNTFAIETDDTLMLVDAGCGATAPDAGRHLDGLAALGIAPADVDVVLMTHLHRDHAAGLIDDAGRAIFPRAELVVHDDELRFWRDDRSVDRLRDSQKWDFAIARTVLAAYADRLKPVGSGAVMAGVSAVPTPGHTPGHTAWLLESDGERLLITGDVVHLPAIQFAHPEASVVYDVDREAAARTRRRILDWVAAEGLALAGVHLDFPCFGHLRPLPGGGFAYTADVWTSVL